MTRVIVELDSAEDAKKVEETVKTGYIEASVENVTQWIGVEEDLADSYLRMYKETKDEKAKEAYAQLHQESKATIAELGSLLKTLEALDRKRVKRIELLTGNLP